MKFRFEYHILDIFFEPMDVRRQCIQVKAKNPGMAEYLKWKIIWEIEKSDYLKRPSELDFHSNVILKEKFYSLMTFIQFFFQLF